MLGFKCFQCSSCFVLFFSKFFFCLTTSTLITVSSPSWLGSLIVLVLVWLGVWGLVWSPVWTGPPHRHRFCIFCLFCLHVISLISHSDAQRRKIPCSQSPHTPLPPLHLLLHIFPPWGSAKCCTCAVHFNFFYTFIVLFVQRFDQSIQLASFVCFKVYLVPQPDG